MRSVGLFFFVIAAFSVGQSAEAAYRLYKLKITTYDIKNRPRRTRTEYSTVDPRQYEYLYSGGGIHQEKIELVDHWYCPGDTGNYRKPCQKPRVKKSKNRSPSSINGGVTLPYNLQPIVP